MRKAKVTAIVIDDSALIRGLLSEILNKDERIEVVATAQDAYEARELIKKHSPDVITLDIEMPKMNGIAFLKNLMRLRPMPVVMISTLTQEGAPETLKALEIGAIDFVAKPNTGADSNLGEYAKEIQDKVYLAANANVRSEISSESDRAEKYASKKAEISSVAKACEFKRQFICAIGASTGGTEAIKEVLAVLPENSPPVVIAQHIPAAFSGSFSKRVDSLARINVFEAEDGQLIEQGAAYIAPGHSHLLVKKDTKGRYVCRLSDSELVNRHRPAVEVLFDSVLETAQQNCLGVILTGMGADGAQALLRMREAGIHTIAQDEESSVVWGMPGAAVKLDAATEILPLDQVAKGMLTYCVKATPKHA